MPHYLGVTILAASALAFIVFFAVIIRDSVGGHHMDGHPMAGPR